MWSRDSGNSCCKRPSISPRSNLCPHAAWRCGGRCSLERKGGFASGADVGTERSRGETGTDARKLGENGLMPVSPCAERPEHGPRRKCRVALNPPDPSTPAPTPRPGGGRRRRSHAAETASCLPPLSLSTKPASHTRIQHDSATSTRRTASRKMRMIEEPSASVRRAGAPPIPGVQRSGKARGVANAQWERAPRAIRFRTGEASDER